MSVALRIAVLMGGPSEEHEVSLKSGRGVAEALRRAGAIVVPLVIPKSLSVAQACAWAQGTLGPLAPDVVFIALHGPFGEDGTIQSVCEALQLAYTGSDVAASRLGMDKCASRERFVQAGLTVPRWQVLLAGAVSSEAVDGLAWPLVVKPTNQGSSIGVSLARDPGALQIAVDEAGHYSETVLIEEFIQGRELTVGVVGDRVLPVVEIRPSQPFFDFSAKYTRGLTEYLVPAPLTPAVSRTVQESGRRAHEALGARHVSRTDLILSEHGEPIVLEVNTIPGFTPTSLVPMAAEAMGMSYDSLCYTLVLMAWQGHRVRATPALVRES